MGRKGERERLEGLEVLRWAHGGEGVAIPGSGARAGGIVFVPDAVPGDVVDGDVVEGKARWARIAVTRRVRASPERVPVPCALQARCGGCPCVGQTKRFGQSSSQLCDMGDPCGNGTTCLDVTRIARVGAYANNAASYGLCLKDQLCSQCTGQWDCPGDLACVNLGGSNLSANHRCVPACTSNADCTEPGLRTCYDSVDASGRPARGCFNKNAGGLPVNRCL